MKLKETKYELQNIISGKSGSSYDSLIQAVASYLRSGKKASPMAEEKHEYKAEETKNLIEFAKQNELIIEDIQKDNVLTKRDILYFIDTVFYIEPKVFWD